MKSCFGLFVVALASWSSQDATARKLSLIQPYIHGGVPAKPNSIPHQVFTYVEDSVWCGGSIIDPSHVLTAAHCCHHATITHVVAGEHSLSKSEGTEQRRRVSSATAHEQYQENVAALNDVCILKLETPLVFNNNSVQSVTLPEQGSSFPEGTECTVSGWGATQEGRASDVLLYVNVTLANVEKCHKKWGGNSSIMLCAGGVSGKGSCVGDSGRASQHTGVVSGGTKPCAQPGEPGFYAKTSGFVEWIRAQLRA